MKKFLLALSLVVISSAACAEEAAKGDQKHQPKGGMMAETDANKDGKVTKDEFVADAAKRFSEIDANKDGNITEEEMKAYHQAQKAKHEQMEKEHAAEEDKRFSEMDTDKDGKISKEEMKAAREKHEQNSGQKKEGGM
jgi:Ca2+-binding EF-hand superfamily protein